MALIRPARSGDGEGMARCWIDAGVYYAALDPELFQVPETEGLSTWMEEERPPPDDGARTTFVAEQAGEVVGFLDAMVIPALQSAAKQSVTEVGERRLVINALIVHRQHWRHGIGTQLMEAAEQWGRRHGATRVALDTWIESQVSVPFYEALGYRKRQLGFRKNLS